MTSLETSSHYNAGESYLSGGFTTAATAGLAPGRLIVRLDIGTMSNQRIFDFIGIFSTNLNLGRVLEEALHYAAIAKGLEYRQDNQGERSVLETDGRFGGVDAVLMADDDGSVPKFFEIGYADHFGALFVFRGEWINLVEGNLEILTEHSSRVFNSKNVKWSRSLEDYTVNHKMLASRTLMFELNVTEEGLRGNWTVGRTYPQ